MSNRVKEFYWLIVEGGKMWELHHDAGLQHHELTQDLQIKFSKDIQSMIECPWFFLPFSYRLWSAIPCQHSIIGLPAKPMVARFSYWKQVFLVKLVQTPAPLCKMLMTIKKQMKTLDLDPNWQNFLDLCIKSYISQNSRQMSQICHLL